MVHSHRECKEVNSPGMVSTELNVTYSVPGSFQLARKLSELTKNFLTYGAKIRIFFFIGQFFIYILFFHYYKHYVTVFFLI